MLQVSGGLHLSCMSCSSLLTIKLCRSVYTQRFKPNVSSHHFSHPPPSDSWKSTWCLRSLPSRQRSDWIQSTAHPKKPQCQVEATNWQVLEPVIGKPIMIYNVCEHFGIKKNVSQVNHTTPLCGSKQLSTPSLTAVKVGTSEKLMFFFTKFCQPV